MVVLTNTIPFNLYNKIQSFEVFKTKSSVTYIIIQIYFQARFVTTKTNVSIIIHTVARAQRAISGYSVQI